MVEAVTWSFISKAQAELFGGGQPALALDPRANPPQSALELPASTHGFTAILAPRASTFVEVARVALPGTLRPSFAVE